MLRIRSVHILWVVVFTTAMSLLPALGQKDDVPRTAPDFVLTTLDGKQIRLSHYSGKVVLLDFWATWCVPCQTEIPRFVSFQNRFAKQGFQVIGISMDDTSEPVKKFYSKFKMNYPVAIGTERVARAYGGVLGLPLTFLIAPDGRIVERYDSSADLDKVEAEIRKLLRRTAD